MDAEHIPPSVMGRWDRARERLTGLERLVVREHLERCSDCREDLVRIGQAPHLSIAPAGDLAEPLDVARVLAGGPTRQRERRSVLTWIAGGWAILATAALVLVAILPRDGGWRPEIEATSVVALSQSRGDGVTVAMVTGGTRLLALAIPPLEGVAGDGVVGLAVLDDRGRQIARSEIPAARMRGRQTVVSVRAPGECWAVGRYLVRVDAREAGGSQFDYALEIRVTP
jgi:hypothetical protein